MTTKDTRVLSAWDGDWEERIRQRITKLGYSTYREYLRATPGVSYRELAAELSKDDDAAPIAPVQLEYLHARSVSPADRRDAVLDSFVRFLRGALTIGLGVGTLWKIDVIGDLSGWDVIWGQGDELDAFEGEIFRMNPTPGWIPKDSDDPLIQEAAKRVWPTE